MPVQRQCSISRTCSADYHRKKDLVIKNCVTQKDMKRLAEVCSICLDAYKTDLNDKKYDLYIEEVDCAYFYFDGRIIL